MPILSTTLCYPNAQWPAQGIFVQRRLTEIARLMPLCVVAPVPWFPILRPTPIQAYDASDPLPTLRPRMFYLPGIAKSLDARFYANALRAGLAWATARGSIDLIDAHFEWPDGVGAWMVAREKKLPFVCTLRGKLVSQIASRSKRRQIAEMLRGANALIAVSQHLAKLANEVAGLELNAAVIPNGVDTSVFYRIEDRATALAKCGWQKDRRYVVSVGHLQELKGFHRLIEVWPQVRKQCGDVSLVLVGGPAGEPAYEQRLHRLVARDKLESAVTFAGRHTPETIAAMLNAADLFAVASRSEGWSNAISEALACGCPVIATNVGGNAEVMNHWGLGKLVELEDREALADKICRALEDPWDRAHIAAYGGRRDWQQVAQECVDVFQKVLQPDRPPVEKAKLETRNSKLDTP